MIDADLYEVSMATGTMAHSWGQALRRRRDRLPDVRHRGGPIPVTTAHDPAPGERPVNPGRPARIVRIAVTDEIMDAGQQ